MRRTAALGAVLTLTAMLVNGTATEQTPFATAICKATHNSYSGGSKKSIGYQLDNGVRFLELDVHDNDYAANHDYQIGHTRPGKDVDHDGNPASNKLRDWLALINAWSGQNSSHAPLVVMLDLKDDLTDNPSFAAGNLAALNAEISGVFESRLALAWQTPSSLPTIETLRGKILVLLSGDGGSRAAYKRDVGYHPAVAINASGQIVEVHDSGAGTLWYWTGRLNADQRITWLRHGKYDSGTTPAVALNDDGYLVEVHQSEAHHTLWYHVGRLDLDGEISWSASAKYDDGKLPTVRFTSPSGTGLREIHQSQSSSQNWQWNGLLNTAANSVAWNGNAKTSDARYDKAVSGSISVWTGADGSTPRNTLHYKSASVPDERIAYEQMAFDEYQDGDSAELQQGALFWAAKASNKSFIQRARQKGFIVRAWDFDTASDATTPLANYPATNQPWTTWYQGLTTAWVR